MSIEPRLGPNDLALEDFLRRWDRATGHPTRSTDADKTNFKQFLSAVCEERLSPATTQGVNGVVAATFLKNFVESFDFKSELIDPEFEPERLILEHLGAQMKSVMTDYHLFQIAVALLKENNSVSLDQMNWLEQKLSSHITNRIETNESVLVSLGWRVSPPHIGHEMVGFFNHSKKGTWKLHIVDTLKDPETKDKPCSARIRYSTVSDFVQKLLSLVSLQFPHLNERKIQQCSERAFERFHAGVYTWMNNETQKCSFRQDRPLTYYALPANPNCAYSYFRPLLSIAARAVIKREGLQLTKEQQQHVKVLTEALHLEFKFYCYNQLRCLYTSKDKTALLMQLCTEKQQFLAAHADSPILQSLRITNSYIGTYGITSPAP